MPASMREVKANINVVNNIKQITSVMKLIAAASLKKARYQLDKTMPFFDKVKEVMVDILTHSREIDNIFFDDRGNKIQHKKKLYLVMSGDKGLAGSYNHNIMKLTQSIVDADPGARLLIAGQVGRSYMLKLGYNVDMDFDFSVQNPSIYRAREISDILLSAFKSGKADEIYILYTRMSSTINLIPEVVRLLPLDLQQVKHDLNVEEVYDDAVSNFSFDYEPSPKDVFDILVPKYVAFIIYFFLVEACTSEQSARMTAMENATSNAEEILKNLQLDFNRARQTAITQEILEIISGASSIGA